MHVLKSVNDSFIVTSSTTAALDVAVTFVDLTDSPATYVPDTAVSKITTAADNTLLGAPLINVKRQLKCASITNIDPAVTNVISVSKLITAAKYKLTPDITLLAGESFLYMHGIGWIYYSANGSVKAQQTASGSNTWIQYNVNGLLGATANFTFDPSTNDLSLLGVDANVIMKGITNEPAAPSAGNLTLYNSKFSGKQIPKYLGVSGMPQFSQDAIWNNNITLWTSGIAAGTTFGNTVTGAGTNTLTAPTSTSRYTMMIRSAWANVITTTNQQLGIRTNNTYIRGDAANKGGFFFSCRFGFKSYKTGSRLFVGMAVGGASIIAGDPSSLTNLCGFGWDLADSAITFIHNDASGTATKEVIASQPALASSQGYDAFVFCYPNDTTIYYRLVDVNTGLLIIESSVNTDLPVNTTLLGGVCLASNGTANIVAGDVSLETGHLYVQSEI